MGSSPTFEQHVRGDGPHALTEADVRATVTDDRLAEWSRAGARELVETLVSVDPDVEEMVFLNDAPRPREFWARRQAHETTARVLQPRSLHVV